VKVSLTVEGGINFMFICNHGGGGEGEHLKLQYVMRFVLIEEKFLK